MSPRKICVVTGTRADYSLCHWPMKAIQDSPDFTLQVIATCMHMSPEFGLTYEQIEKDGFHIDEKVEMLLSADTPSAVAKSMGVATISFADAFNRLKPDLVVLMGDRFELLAAAQTALIFRIPIAHFYGGDTTEGAFDEAIRHSITKMSQLHFPTNEESAQRIRQLGENPDYIFNVGSPALDHITHLSLLDRKQLSEALDFELKEKNFLVTFHPATLDEDSAASQFQELLDSLAEFSEYGIIFTLPNADTTGRALISMVHDFTEKHPNAKAYTSLGQLRYLSLLNICDAVIGNSSSGILEAPSFKIPTINIGDRQKGRLQAKSVFNCEPKANAISTAIKSGLAANLSQVENPYGDGKSSPRILEKLNSIKDFSQLIKKSFHS